MSATNSSTAELDQQDFIKSHVLCLACGNTLGEAKDIWEAASQVLNYLPLTLYRPYMDIDGAFHLYWHYISL